MDLKREIVAAFCVLLFSELKNLEPWNFLPNRLIFVRAGNR